MKSLYFWYQIFPFKNVLQTLSMVLNATGPTSIVAFMSQCTENMFTYSLFLFSTKIDVLNNLTSLTFILFFYEKLKAMRCKKNW